MPLAYSTRYKKYEPVSTTRDFIVPFPIFDSDDLLVVIGGVETTAFTLAATFVAGVSNDAVITINTGVLGVDVEILGNRLPRRENAYLSNSPNLGINLQRDMDALTAVLQEQLRDFSSALRVSREVEDVSELALSAALRQNRVVAFSADGLSLIAGPDLTDVEGAGLAATTAVAAAAAAETAADIAEGNAAIQKPKTYLAADLTTPLVLDFAPADKGLVSVYIDGVKQDQEDFTLSGDELTFIGGWPDLIEKVEVVILGAVEMLVSAAEPSDTANRRQGLFWDGLIYTPRDTYILDNRSITFDDASASVANAAAIKSWLTACMTEGAIGRVIGSGKIRSRSMGIPLVGHCQLELNPSAEFWFDNSFSEAVAVGASQSVFTSGVDFTPPVGWWVSRVLVDGTPLRKWNRGADGWDYDGTTLTLAVAISGAELSIEYGEASPLFDFQWGSEPEYDLIIKGFSGDNRHGAQQAAVQSNTLIDAVRIRRLIVHDCVGDGGPVTSGFAGDSFITPVSCESVYIGGSLFKNFQDASIYTGGGGSQAATSDDGTKTVIENNLFKNCFHCATNKRQGAQWVFTGNTSIDCDLMYTMYDSSGVDPCYGGTFTNNTMIRGARTMLEVRGGVGAPRAVTATGNRVVDFGYFRDEAGVLTRDTAAQVFRLRGTSGNVIRDNKLEMREWTPHADIVGVQVEKYTVNGTEHTPGENVIRDNDYLGGWITQVREATSDVGPTKCTDNRTHGTARGFDLLNPLSFDGYTERGADLDYANFVFQNPGDSAWNYASPFYQRRNWTRTGNTCRLTVDIQGDVTWSATPPTGYWYLDCLPYLPKNGNAAGLDSCHVGYSNVNIPDGGAQGLSAECVGTTSTMVKFRLMAGAANDNVIDAAAIVAGGTGVLGLRFTLVYDV